MEARPEFLVLRMEEEGGASTKECGGLLKKARKWINL